jgi:Leucine-rich repeat (LRR) protein
MKYLNAFTKTAMLLCIYIALGAYSFALAKDVKYQVADSEIASIKNMLRNMNSKLEQYRVLIPPSGIIDSFPNTAGLRYFVLEKVASSDYDLYKLAIDSIIYENEYLNVRIDEINFQYLKYLSFIDTDIRDSINSINCPELTSLTIANSQMKVFSGFSFPKLKYLNISKCKAKIDLASLNCPNLDTLIIDETRCSSLEKISIGNLKKLSAVKCRLSGTLENLPFKDLEYLNLSYNSIARVTGINLDKLKTLILNNNQIDTLADISFPSLEYFDLNNNKITELPQADFRNLKKLYANHNNLSSAKLGSNSKSLIEIDLSNNIIKMIDELTLRPLSKVDLSNNQIEKIASIIAEAAFDTLKINNNKLNFKELNNLFYVKRSYPQSIIQWGNQSPKYSFVYDSSMNQLSYGNSDVRDYCVWKSNYDSSFASNTKSISLRAFEVVDDYYVEIRNSNFPNLMFLCKSEKQDTTYCKYFISQNDVKSLNELVAAAKDALWYRYYWNNLDSSFSSLPQFNGLKFSSEIYTRRSDTIIFKLNLSEIDLENTNSYDRDKIVEDLEIFNKFPNLRKLVLNYWSIPKIGSLKLDKLNYLDLNNNNILDFGTLALPNLTYLNLSNNKFNSAIPSIDFPNLLELQMVNSGLQGETPRLNCPKIEAVNLSKNNLTSISPEYFEYQNLKTLNLSYNKLSKFQCSTNKSNINYLDLSHNLIEHDIPVINARNIKYLDLSNNQFTGKVFDIANLTNLSTFKINNNKLSGINGILVSNLISGLDLSYNKFTEIPDISKLSQLTALNLSNNELKSPMPTLTSNILKELNLSYNQLSGTFPKQNLVNLNNLRLSYNKFNKIDDSLSLPNCSDFYIDHNNFAGEFPDIKFGTLWSFDISNNEFSSVKPGYKLEHIVKLNYTNNRFDTEYLRSFSSVCIEQNPISEWHVFPQKALHKLIYDEMNKKVICPYKGKYVYQWKIRDNQIVDTLSNVLELKNGVSINDVLGCEIYFKDFIVRDYVWCPNIGGALRYDFVLDSSRSYGVYIDSSEIAYLNRYFYTNYVKDSSRWFGWPISSDTVRHGLRIDNLGFTFTKINDSLYRANVDQISFKNLDIYNLKLDSLPYLKYMYFDNCSLDIQNISKIPELSTLVCINSKLNTEIKELISDSLKVLKIINCGLLGKSPKLRSNIVNYIDLSNNLLTRIDESYKDLQLEYLYLQNNQISGTMLKYDYSQLKDINISNNKITGDIGNINAPKLRNICFQNNALRMLPDSINASNLTLINLDSNNFKCVLKQWNTPNLIQFSMSYNRDSMLIDTALNYQRMERFSICNSKFYGDFTKFNYASITNFDVSHNEFECRFTDYRQAFYYSNSYHSRLEIPKHSLSMDFSFNKFFGKLPHLETSSFVDHYNYAYVRFNFQNNNFTSYSLNSSLAMELIANFTHNKILPENIGDFGIAFRPSVNPQDTTYYMYYSPKDSMLIVIASDPGNEYNWSKYNGTIQDDKRRLKLNSTEGISNIQCEIVNNTGGLNLHYFAIYKGEISGVEDEVFSSEISISPNPAQDYIQLNSKLELLDNPHVSIYNQLGEKVAESNSSRIDLINLPNGVYRLILEASGKRAAKSFVISR